MYAKGKLIYSVLAVTEFLQIATMFLNMQYSNRKLLL